MKRRRPQPRIIEEALTAANGDPAGALLLVLKLIEQGLVRAHRRGLTIVQPR